MTTTETSLIKTKKGKIKMSEYNTNVTVNANNKEENTMANNNTAVEINTNENIRTAGQFAIEFQQNGNGGCIPVINGNPEPMLMFGYVSESDKQGCIKLIREGLLATDGDVYKTMSYIKNAVTIAANDIKPDETIDVEGTEMLVSYRDKKIYLGTEEVANLDDMAETEMNNEVIKALLKERAKNRLAEMQINDMFDDFDEYDDEYDY